MKASSIFKLLLLIALVSWMHLVATPAQANVTTAAVAEVTAPAKQVGVPETSSVVLIGAVGLMLMLRRRRLHA